MNRIDFTLQGGFPLDQDIFGFQQLNSFMLQQMAELCGPRAILAGCVVTGAVASAGYVVIDGEVLPFTGGYIDAKVRIVEVATDLTYEDGAQHPSQIERYAAFGDDGVTAILWTDFKRNKTEGVLARLDRLEWLTAPDRIDGGSMRFWNRSFAEIPAGWQEVTDFAGRFPMGRKEGVPAFDLTDDGFGNLLVGEGGAETHTLTNAEIPAKSVTLPNSSVGGRSDNANDRDVMIPAAPQSIQVGGGGQAHSILNPYRIVLFIEPIPNYIQ